MSAKIQVGLEDGWNKETQMSLQIFTELWKSPMELKCLGTFVFPHWACLNLQAFGYLWQSAHCFISFTSLCWVCPNYRLGWRLLKQQFLRVDPPEHFFKKEEIREVRRREGQGKGRKEEGFSGLLSNELLMFQLRVTAPVWTSSSPCWCNVFELWALHANEHFHMLRLHWIPRVILGNRY